jgi:type I restriction enzyme R subunit
MCWPSTRRTSSRHAQVPCHPGDHDTVDMVFAVNGLPVATIELKNPGTHPELAARGAQYQKDRDPRAPLFDFKKRALVHFAADPDEVHMATRLRGEETTSCPSTAAATRAQVQCGAGNPQHASGYRTGYFWEEVLQRDSFLDILGHFMFVEKDEKVDDGKGGQRLVTKEKMVFPRYHQLDAVRARRQPRARKGRSQLPDPALGGQRQDQQHLVAVAPAGQPARRAGPEGVRLRVVITDRKVLDKQLQDAIYQIEHAQGVVKAIDQDSKQLADALIDGTKIVITTLQKFPFVLRGLLHAAGAENQEKATATRRRRRPRRGKRRSPSAATR